MRGISRLSVKLICYSLCSRAMNHLSSERLVDRFLFMMSEDQGHLRDCMRRESLLDELLEQRAPSGDKSKSAAESH